ncbi:hypothetical protein LUZ60_000670 [Juncus effusus]|nr:hypothetical protein LUZ60_000670 [Juncus effusus]
MAPSFSILFPISSKQYNTDEEELSLSDNLSSSITSSSSTSSSVDCTLSLGTPSTRRNDSAWTKKNESTAIYWDVLSEPSKNSNVTRPLKGCDGSNDQFLFARRCANCDTTSTPLWRNGPRGPKSLCNACGIRYKKEERRAAATSAIHAEQGTACGYQQSQPWSFYSPTAGAKSAHNISMYDPVDSADVASYLPWRFNAVTVPATPFPIRERVGLFQYN